MISRLEQLCAQKGLKLTEQRRVIARILSQSHDHPDVESVFNRAKAFDKKISLATVYRTLRLFEDAGILEKHDFKDGRARYEELTDQHHDHLIDVSTGNVIEFFEPALEEIKQNIALKLGYQLIDHRLELYAVPLKNNTNP